MTIVVARGNGTYTRLRSAQVRREVRNLVETVKGTAPVIIGIAGPMGIALPAFAAVPFLYAASTTWQVGLLVLLATLCGSLVPFVLLVRRFLPREQLQWEAALPITARERLAADSVTAGYWLAFLCPLITLSMVIWRLENPRWIWHLWSIVLPLAAGWCGMVFLACHGALRLRVWQVRYAERGRRPSPRTAVRAEKALRAIAQLPGRASAVRCATALIVKPMIRREQAQLGRMLLFLTALEAIGTWLWFNPAITLVTAGAKGITVSMLAVFAYALLDGQIGRHVDGLRTILAGYPIQFSSLYRSAFVIAGMPTIAAVVLASASGVWHRVEVTAHIAWLYGSVLVISTAGIAVLRVRAPKYRPVWAVMAAILLSAIGAYVQ